MPNLNINWKGYPHRIPRIRLASPPQASFHATAPHIAAQNVFTSPLSPILEEAREIQRIKSRRGRRRSASSTTRARKRASRRARQDIQVFGWDTPRAMGTSTESIRSDTSGTVINWSPDPGPATTKPAVPKAKTYDRDNVYSLMQVAERTVKLDKAGKVVADSSREYSHTRPVEMVSGKDIRDVSASNRQKTYDPRITFTKSTSRSRKVSSLRGPLSRRASKASNASARSSKRPAQTPTRSNSKQNPARLPNRAAKDQKKLNRYVKELELYIQAAKTLSNRRSAPSSSPTIKLSPTTKSLASIHTIQALEPYRDQFESAGLAVTSADQLKKTPLRKISLLPPPTPRKDPKWRQNPNLHGSKPNTDKTENLSKAKAESVSTTRTDGAADPKTTQKPSPKKSLPWLKKRDSTAIASPAPNVEPIENKKAKSDASSCSSTIISFAPAHEIPKRAEIPTRRPPVPPKDEDQKFRDAQVMADMIVESAREAEGTTSKMEESQPKDAQKMVGMIKESAKQPDKVQSKSEEQRVHEAQVMMNMIIESLEQAGTTTPMSEDRIKEAQRIADGIMESTRQSGILSERSMSLKRPRPSRPVLGCQRRSFSNQATPVTSNELDWVDDLDEEVSSDMDVIKGLHIATSAACNEDINAQIKFTTDIDIRKFLADLTSLDIFCAGLGIGYEADRGPRGFPGPRGPRGKKGKDGCDSVVYVINDKHDHCKHVDQKLGFAAGDQADLEYMPVRRQQKMRELNETVDRLAKWKATKATEGYGAGGCGAGL